MHNLSMVEAFDYKSLIESIERDLESLSEQQEDLSDKGQVTYHLAQKITEKRKELESIRGFIHARSND